MNKNEDYLVLDWAVEAEFPTSNVFEVVVGTVEAPEACCGLATLISDDNEAGALTFVPILCKFIVVLLTFDTLQIKKR